MSTTLDYYEKNALTFFEGTAHVDMSSIYHHFVPLLPQQSHILDVGCGSGRDSKYFLEQGFNVTAIDATPMLCQLATNLTGIKVLNMNITEIEWQSQFDGIWACASLLHLTHDELKIAFNRLNAALKTNGVLYCSFKHGEFSGDRNGRFFTDLTLSALTELISPISNLYIYESFITGDVRPGRHQEEWLNVVLKSR